MINALFAADQFGGIGQAGTLPWPHNSNDLRNFKQLTDGHVVVMGRRTWDDPKMPKPLKGRIVYVATNTPIYEAATIKGDLLEQVTALEKSHPNKTIWVVGGADILAQCSDLYDRIYLTHFKGNFKIDTKVNLKSLLATYRIVSATAAPDDNCTFVVYESIFDRSKRSTD
jgi:dihydrofolate reductase